MLFTVILELKMQILKYITEGDIGFQEEVEILRHRVSAIKIQGTMTYSNFRLFFKIKIDTWFDFQGELSFNFLMF